jgi:adenosine deaminase
VNTDTPAVFDTTLTGELSLLERSFGLDRSAVEQVIVNAFEASFLPPAERAALVESVRAELASVRH